MGIFSEHLFNKYQDEIVSIVEEPNFDIMTLQMLPTDTLEAIKDVIDKELKRREK